MAKEVRSMETINLEAELMTVEEKQFIRITAEPVIDIPISDDNPNAVKSAFCALIRKLRSGPLRISLMEAENDLFYQVSTAYLDQLNGELAAIYEEMEKQGFIDSEGEES